MQTKALVLLSGGIDSTTCLALAKHQHTSILTLSFDYGQKHRAELQHAAQLAQHFHVEEHLCYTFNPSVFQGSALTDPHVPIPDATPCQTVKSTYVPVRNLIFLSIACAIAESREISILYFGANKADQTGFPDCRPEFLRAFVQTAQLATKPRNTMPFEIRTPLLNLEKHEIITLGLELGIDYRQTVTCYRADTNGNACGCCDSCEIRKQGFQLAQISDPTRYVA